MSQLQLYLVRRTLITLAASLAVVTAIIFLIDFVELSRTVGVRAKEVSIGDVFGLASLQSPAIILVLLPFVFLFGVMAAYVNMNRRSELVAMRASGVSAWGFIMPAAVLAAVLGVVTVAALNPIAARMDARFQALQSQMMEGYLGEAPKAIWIRQGDKHGQVIVRAASSSGPGVRLNGVAMFVYALEPDGSARFQQRIEAKEARLEPGQWRLTDVRLGLPGAKVVTAASLLIPSNLSPNTALERFATPTAIAFWSLPSMIARTEKAGFSATAYRVQLQELLATPLMFAALSVIGAAFSLRLFRLGGLAGLAGAGVALGFAFFFIGQFCTALGRADVLPAVVAGWTPPLLALLAGATLLCYTEDG